MYYEIVENVVLGRLMDVHVPREAGGGVSDNLFIVTKVKEGAAGYIRMKKQVQCKEDIEVS